MKIRYNEIIVGNNFSIYVNRNTTFCCDKMKEILPLKYFTVVNNKLIVKHTEAKIETFWDRWDPEDCDIEINFKFCFNCGSKIKLIYDGSLNETETYDKLDKEIHRLEWDELHCNDDKEDVKRIENKIDELWKEQQKITNWYVDII